MVRSERVQIEVFPSLLYAVHSLFTNLILLIRVELQTSNLLSFNIFVNRSNYSHVILWRN